MTKEGECTFVFSEELEGQHDLLETLTENSISACVYLG